MRVLAEGQDICRGNDTSTVCGFYDEENDKCWYGLDHTHLCSCANYCANDSCMFCAIHKDFKCMLLCDYIDCDTKACEDFRPVDIKKFYR